MARKRKKLRHLDYNSPEYWNRLLVQEGLSVDRALQPNKLTYVGNATDIEYVEGSIRMDNGRIEPKPQAE
jgi:hypothetical protein